MHRVSPWFSLCFLTLTLRLVLLTLEDSSEAFLGPPNHDSNLVQQHPASQHQPQGTEQHYVSSAHFQAITFSMDWCSGMKINLCVHPCCKHGQVIPISFCLNQFGDGKELDKVLSHVLVFYLVVFSHCIWCFFTSENNQLSKRNQERWPKSFDSIRSDQLDLLTPQRVIHWIFWTGVQSDET